MKPWKVESWVIPPKQSSSFVAHMEQVLDVYKRPYNALNPVICMDESPKQLIKEVRKPVKTECGRVIRIDYEYERCGVCNIFMACEPLIGKRFVEITQRKTKNDWAEFIRELADVHYPNADKITLVMDNLNTHKPYSFYDTFSPEEAKRLWDRFEFVYTPKHGSWLNIAEIEFNVLHSQCLSKRIETIEEVARQAKAWQHYRNNLNAKVNWQFTSEDARIKLKRLYPTF